ncbi:MAG: response regulator [Phycisphaerae bacterium]|nr:response regulator [Gemmatimonadaceae bacterium]
MATFRATFVAVACSMLIAADHAPAQEAASGSPSPGDPRLPVGARLVDLSVRRFGKADGLQSPTVYAVSVDLSGSLWIGTEVGPMRFDGDRWQPESYPSAVTSRQTRGILQSSDSSYWFATRAGMVRKRGAEQRLFGVRDGLPGATAYSVIETRALSGHPQVLVGTGTGIAVFDGKGFSAIPLPDGLKPDGLMVAEARAPDGSLELWVASSSGKVARFTKGRWSVFGAAHGLNSRSAEAVVAVEGDSAMRILIVGDGGLYTFREDAARGPRFELMPGSPRRAYRAVQFARSDGARELWVGTLSGIVLRKTQAGWDTVDVASQQLGGRVTALHVVAGHAGGTAVYVGTYGGRLARVGVGSVGTLELPGIRRDVMRAVLPFQSKDGRVGLWMGTLNAGLLQLTPAGRMIEYSRETGEPFTQISALASVSSVKRPAHRSDTTEEKQDLWIGTELGPFRREGTRFVKQTRGMGQRDVRVFLRGPLPDASSSLLAATDNGLYRWLGTEWELVRAFGYKPVRAMSVVKGATGEELWLAFDRGTASVTTSAVTMDSPRAANDTSSSANTQSKSFQQLALTSICGMNGASYSARIFAGTTTNGLWWRSPDAVWQRVPVTLQRAIGPTGIRALSCLDDGRLLVAMGTGLIVLDVHDARAPRWTVLSVTSQEDGLPASEIQSFAPASMKGLFWMGTSRGLGALQLQRIASSSVPKLSLALQSEGRSLRLDNVRQLQADHSELTIRTVLQSYHREDDTRYRVWLNREGEPHTALDSMNAGMDDSLSWTDAADAHYRSLPAGHYTLYAWARDFAGRIVTLPVTRFRVVPPVWQTWWAVVLYVALVASAIYIAHRWRLQTLERTNARLATSERHMRASERKFRALFDEATDGHLLIDGMHITSINAPGRQMLGLEPQPTFYANPVAVLPAWDQVLPPAIASELGALALDGEIHEYDIQLANGVVIPVSAQVTTVPLDDRSLWHLVLRDLRDIREADGVRQRLEEQVRDAQKFESLGTLAGGVAHDFNNLLGVIRGNVELARETLGDQDAVAVHLDTVFDASERARDLVRQILTFSRRSSSREEFVDLARLTRELQPMLRSMIPTSVEIVVDAGTRPMLVHGDSTQLQQILLNLSSNAEHAMRATGGGKLHIILDGALSEDSPSSASTQMVRLRVTDSGVGMTPAVLGRVFEPFYTTKPTGEGTGLGMAVLHGIVASHGGKVHVSSEVGVGTTFEVLLPAATTPTNTVPVQVDAPLPEPNTHAWQSGMNATMQAATSCIVLVDDEPAVARVGEAALTRLGYRVVTFVDPLAALAFVQKDPDAVDLVVTDQTMPGLTGDLLVIELQRLRPDLPVIIMSGFSYVLTADRLSAVGTPTVLQKPVSLSELRLAVERALEGRAVASRA